MAIDREIVQVKALPPREWFVLPHSVEEGSVAVSIPPDASVQLVIETNSQKKTKLQVSQKRSRNINEVGITMREAGILLPLASLPNELE